MRRCLVHIAAIIFFLPSNRISLAQQVRAESGSIAIGRDVNQSTINIGIPPSQLDALVRQTADLSEAQKKLISELEGKLDLNQRQIQTAFDILGEKNVRPEQLAARLVDIAERLKFLQTSVATQPGEAPNVHALKTEAQRAIDDGDLAKADALLANAEAEETRSLDRLAISASDTANRRGEISGARLRYREAAEHFARAATLLQPVNSRHARWIGLIGREADALLRQGSEFGDNAALLLAIERRRQQVRLQPRELGVRDWAMAQHDLGVALETLGEREDSAARLQEAIDVFRDPLKYLTRESAPRQWAVVESGLGVALMALAQREQGIERLGEAVSAFGEALKELTRERDPWNWAVTQTNLGSALTILGERDSGTARLEEAVTTLRAVLKEWPRVRRPLEWAEVDNRLGVALQTLGERENSAARLEEAIEAYREALKEQRQEQVPLAWAMTQTNLGGALHALGVREDGTARLDEAAEAYREALKEQTRERVPLDRVKTESKLALTEKLLAERRK